jgi:hypothetical protein
MPTSLRFHFPSIEAELSAMKTITSSFMEPASLGVFEAAISNLKMIRTGGAGKWGPTDREPLRTLPSDDYEKNSKAAHPIYAELSWVWELTADKPKKKNTQAETFQVTGLASVRVQLKHYEDESTLADWRAELGAVDSPGSYFHTHITDHVCVPRLPTLFVTPMDTLEFVLGEIFQRRWPEVATSEKADVLFWRSTQSRLLSEVLDWKRKRIIKGSGSPWVALKHAKPEDADSLFVKRR